MNKQDELYVALINVPAEMTKYNSVNIFVEIRAEIMGASTEGEPIFITKINNLLLVTAVIIDWVKFWTLVDELVTKHFKQLKVETVC